MSPRVYPTKRFGRLVVRERSSEKEGYWICDCDCGNEASVYRSNLGKCTNSCGCLWTESRREHGREIQKMGHKPAGYAMCTRIILDYRSNAKRRGLAFELTREELEYLFQGDCHYCDLSPHTTRLHKGETFTYNGIDRIDSSKGYESSNVVTCCETRNRAKSDSSYEDFRAWIQRLVTRRPVLAAAA